MLKSTYTPLPPLPPGWTEYKAPSGHLYYYHAETKQSTYKRPSAPVAAPHVSLSHSSQYDFQTPTPDPVGHISAAFGHGTSRKELQPDRRYERRQPLDRPKSKQAIPQCEPWVLVKTKLGRRFVHNPETNESFWKFPEPVLKGVVEFGRRERERRERRDRGELSEEEVTEKRETLSQVEQSHIEERPLESGDSDEYEEVEVTDEEEDGAQLKKARIEESADQPLEFNEDDIAYQLAAMGEDYGLDPGEYGEPGQEGWEEGAEGLPLSESDATALFRDLLDDYGINPYSPWEKIVDEGKIIDDARYTILPNMKLRREAWSGWSRDRIQEHKERKEKEEKKDPKIRYLAFLDAQATPKLFWPEFKRKFRKEPEMKETNMSDKDRERLYREHIGRLKLPESTRKSDLLSLLKSIPLSSLNRSSSIETLDSIIQTDLRFISLPPKIRNPLVETYISTLPDASKLADSAEAKEDDRQREGQEKLKREQALADREDRVWQEKQTRQRAIRQGKNMLRQGDDEIQNAMHVGKTGLKNYLEDEK